MTTPTRRTDTSVLAELAVPALLVAVAAAIGFVLLELVKHIIVVLTYALGFAFIVVALLAAHRMLAGQTGHERWVRIRGLAGAVGLGVLLLVIAHLVSRHGWLLVVVPAAWIAVSRVSDTLLTRRRRHKQDRSVSGV